MIMTFIGLNTAEYERSVGSGESSPLPAGFYSGTITRSELRDNKSTAKDPNGKYLEVEFDIAEPSEFGNRKFWDKFNLMNTNPVAVKIGKEQLADLAKAVGLETLNEADELEGKSVSFYLTVKPAQNGYNASNACMKYLPIGSTEDDYQAWLGNAKSAAKGDKKAWNAAPAATSSTTQAKAAAPWKAKK